MFTKNDKKVITCALLDYQLKCKMLSNKLVDKKLDKSKKHVTFTLDDLDEYYYFNKHAIIAGNLLEELFEEREIEEEEEE